MLSCLVWGVAFAQFSLEVSAPAGSTLTISPTKVSLDLGEVAFPPLAFPAYFDLTHPDSPITIELFSNIEGGWKLTVAFDDFAGLESEEGNVLLPSHIVYRLNGAGEWRQLTPKTILLTDHGVSAARECLELELRLKLLGNERPGTYEGTLVFSLAPLAAP